MFPPSSSPLEYLSNARVQQTRNSLATFETAQAVLKGKGKASFKGDDQWNVVEQLAVASLDLGRLYQAHESIEQLIKRFPSSPRTFVLEGMLLEARGLEAEAKAFYEKMLVLDETSILAHRRLLSLPSLTTEQRIPLLLKYLDTFYTDIDAWVLLSELYASIELYTPALASLSHTLILAPQNPLHYLRHAETAYTLGDLPLAFKSYLLCLSLTERVKDGSEGQGKGLAVRAWWGVKLTTRSFLSSSSSSVTSTSAASASGVPRPPQKEIEEFSVLATKWLFKIYSGKKGVDQDSKRALVDGFLKQ